MNEWRMDRSEMNRPNFRNFDRSKPLVSLHVPKCAGSGLWQALQDACSPSFRVFPYYPDIGFTLPADWDAGATIIHGHFVRRDGHAVETVCRGASQFMTVLRDPFEVVVSAWFYGANEGMSWAASHSIDSFMEWWLAEDIGPLMSALPTIEGHRNIEDYASSFIHIGTVRNMLDFYSSLERILDVKMPAIEVVNASDYTERIPDLESAFRKKFSLDYELYNFVDRMKPRRF
jgi:hypothetical protein